MCTIEGIDGEESFKEEIQLPCSVRKKGTRAIYRSGVLEIRMPKHVNIPIISNRRPRFRLSGRFFCFHAYI